jgi:tetratricopeptide (TPR) repeat protein
MASAINIGILLLALLSLAASFNPHWHIWGVDSFRALPVILRFILMGLLIVSIIPSVSKKLGNAIYERLKSLTDKKAVGLYLFICLFLLAFFVAFSSRNHLLGDGYSLAGNIAGGQYFSPTEPLEYLWHYGAFRLVGGGDAGALLTFALCAYLAGAIFLIGLFFFIENKRHLLLALTFISTFAAVQFFFGYVENYTYSFVFAFLYLCSAIRDIEQKKISLPTILFFLLMVGFHLMYAVLTPSLIYLFLNKYQSRFLLTIGLIIAVMLAVGGMIFLGKYMSLSQIFLPLHTVPDSPYHLLSVAHMLDLLNLLLLNYPSIFIIFFLAPGWTKVDSKTFLMISIVGTFLFIIFVDPKMAAFRDWDMMALATAPLFVFFLQSFQIRSGTPSPETYRTFLPLVLFALIHSGSWIWQNTHKDETYLYIKDIIHSDPHYTQDYYQGYRNKSWGMIAGEFYEDKQEAILAWERRFAGYPKDGANAMSLAAYYLLIGDSARAHNFVIDHWRKYLRDPHALTPMSNILIKTNDSSAAEEILEELINAGFADYSAYNNLAILKSSRGQIDSAFYLFDLSLKLRPDKPVNLELSFYLSAFSNGQYDLAQEGLGRILRQLNPADRDIAERILNALKNRDETKIDSLKSILLPQGKSPQTLETSQ